MKKTLLLLSLLLGSMGLAAQQLAFPGAEGFGAFASGGRGGQVVHVTNLNASGTGSLADAVSQSGRFVVFDVGGVIDITGKSITIASNVTIAGQTAPGEGITIYGGRVIASKSKNIIMRYIRMRGGKSVNSSKCTLTLDECQNVIMDHCSVSWGPWDNVHIKDANNITWQHSIISEGIEPQRFGSITDGTRNWTIHHCLWANNKSRNPKMKCYVQYYNNIVYNYTNGVVGGHSAADNYQDLMNNYFIAGPEGSAKYFDQWTETDHMYSSGNYFDGNCDGVLNGSLITDHHSATAMSSPSLKSSGPMNLESARDAYYTVVEHVGASRVRDVHDRRVLEQLTSLGKKGNYIANEDNVGGIGILAGGAKPKDTDNDGMPDQWEEENGLNPNVNDANGTTFGNGYTNIENYVNSLAQKSSYLMYPMSPDAVLLDATTVKLSWVLSEAEEAVAIVVEQSEDGKNFHEIQRLDPTATTTTVEGLTEKQIYYFRMKVVGEKLESMYSAVVSVNDEFMRPGGGTDAGTSTFAPKDGKLYRIINYATVPYNSSTNLGGTPKYLTFNADGTLGSTEEYLWDDPALLWEILPATNGYYLRNYSTKRYPSPTNVSSNGSERIVSYVTRSPFTINYVGDQQAGQSGVNRPLSMYRINCPSNNNQQIRARGFANDWIWGSGTIDRADMIFTFVEVEASLVRLFLTKYDSALEQALQLAREARTDVTLGYPSSALDAFMTVIANAQSFAENITEETTQKEVDAQVTALTKAMTEFRSKQIQTFAGFSDDLCYLIYSYGTMSNASASSATADIERRYLYSRKNFDGKRDSLVYRIGLSDSQIASGRTDALATDPAALWAFTEGEDGYVYARNQKSGAYLQIENLLASSPVTIRPSYAKMDNGKMAFYMFPDTQMNRCFNVGNPDSDGKGGPLGFFAGYADRTRLRWVIDETEVEVTTAVTSPSASIGIPHSVRYYNLQGMELSVPPTNGIYVKQETDAAGQVRVTKIVKQ